MEAAKKGRKRGPRIRRLVQAAGLLLFLAIMAGATMPLLEPDAFVSLGPLAGPVSALAGRSLGWWLLPSLLVLASAFFLGRAFCGWLCPLGATLDATDKFIARKRPASPYPRLGKLRYLFLALTLGAALFGVSLVFFFAPLSLATRFYGLLLGQALSSLSALGLTALQPLAAELGWRSLYFAEFKVSVYATWTFILLFFVLLAALGRLAPRFWCSHLCPAGALLAIFGREPAITRRVSEACTDCGACARACPTAALAASPQKTDTSRCIACRTCQAACPAGAISFLPGEREKLSGEPPLADPPLASRRTLLAAAAAGGGLSLASLAFPGGEALAKIAGRPPGALPEQNFLARCIRCGQCMVACPTNTLQPVWLATGPLGLFSPAITPRVGFCDPLCHACAGACPTNAIREIPPDDRLWAKTGTAAILRKKCLAWENKKKCLVCDEVCPYDAVSLKPEPGNPVMVPHLDEKKCLGCGFCEHHCPATPDKAIIVAMKEDLRLESGSYEQAAKERGLSLIYAPRKKNAGYPEPGAETGAEQGATSGGLPPGFTN